ncbi:hypothetical protein AVEN_26309-1 [Araneus ventricosus]|uniref:Uncharacterized protein n=1 Tax=Araneus ventricosus TaxID=182803 RepID=A0A4Y2APG2_ARAVE|nr:hypothetical protein AVEN_26309-1 [Araneus ventricosus]
MKRSGPQELVASAAKECRAGRFYYPPDGVRYVRMFFSAPSPLAILFQKREDVTDGTLGTRRRWDGEGYTSVSHGNRTELENVL